MQRNTINLNRNRNQIIHEIENDTSMKNKWSVYQTKYSYAENISYNDVISSIKSLLKRCQSFNHNENQSAMPYKWFPLNHSNPPTWIEESYSVILAAYFL
jgi:predicted transcriptional regulator